MSLDPSKEEAYYGKQERTTPPPDDVSEETLLGSTSPGVRRMEAISESFTLVTKSIFMISIFLVSYTYGLDNSIRYNFQSFATSSYQTHSLYATIQVVRGVVAAAAQPTIAKLGDVFGRFEVLCFSIFFYVIGTILEAQATNVQTFAGATVIYQIGYTGMMLLVEVLVGDVTSLRSRLFFSYIPATPFIINTWISGDVQSAVMENSTWQWGIRMWCIIFPVVCIPLICTMLYGSHKAKKEGRIDKYTNEITKGGFVKTIVTLFWQLDVIGVLLVVAIFALILVPLTLAGGFEAEWKKAKIIAPIVIGFLCIPAFIFWERKAKHPLVPFKLLSDRGVWSALLIGVNINFCWYMQGDYLFAVLQVAFGESVKSATRIAALYSFVSVITGTILGLVVHKVRYLKPFILFGTAMWILAFGLLIQFRGGSSRSQHAGLIAAQCLLGFGAGFFTYPTQTSIQATTRHEVMAVITALYLASYNIGTSLGASVSGAIWTQVMPQSLSDKGLNETLSTMAYGSPYEFIAAYPMGTFERQAAVEAYQHVQRLLCITGICLAVVMVGLALFLRNPRLGEEQSLPENERPSEK